MKTHQSEDPRVFLLIVVVLGLVRGQLLPHPPNVTPIGALALGGGAVVAKKRAAFVVPLTALFLIDLALGLMGGNLSRGSIGDCPLWMGASL